MNRKISIAALALVMFALAVGVANAQIYAKLELKDSGGNNLNGETIPPGTVVYVHANCNLEGSSAYATLFVYHDDGSGLTYEKTLYNGLVNDGETIIDTFTVTEHGTYQFELMCEKINGEGSIKCEERVRVIAQTFVIPEPGTIAGLMMALSAFGLLAFKKLRTK